MRKEYRNSIRSRTLIKNALIVLMQSKPFSEITVTDVVNEAGISRGTFYAHYSNTNEAALEIEDEVVDLLLRDVKALPPKEIVFNYSKALDAFNCALSANRELLLSLLPQVNPERFVATHREALMRYMMNDPEIRALSALRPNTFEPTLRFILGGIISVYLDWFEGRLTADLQDIPRLIRYSLDPLMAHFLTSPH